MTLTVKELIEQLQRCDPNQIVMLTTDWANEKFIKVTEIVPNILYDPEAEEFESSTYDLTDEEELEEIDQEDWVEILNRGTHCVILC